MGCLIATDDTLGFAASLAVATSCAVFMCLMSASLTVSGSLRLLTLVTKSEARGIQLLGPDDAAIGIVRLISFLFAFCFVFVAIFGFTLFPGPFYVFYYSRSMSMKEPVLQNLFQTLEMDPL
jgi:hypothetical protein